jgi:hypothetical protein
VSTPGPLDGSDIAKGLIDAVASLVATGPVPLGGYTLAEIDAVSGIVQFLEEEPAPELVAEAVRSLAARNLVTTTEGSDQVQVRGDLGIALAFQHRARTVLDARITGSEPDRPWRFVLMPHAEGITLEILIDALGIHFYSLRMTEDATGDRETHDVVLAQDGDRCHVFVRDADDPAQLVAQGLDDDDWRDLVTRLARRAEQSRRHRG